MYAACFPCLICIPWLTVVQPKERKGSFFFTEFRAGLATFFAMAYIISVNCMPLLTTPPWAYRADLFY